MSAADVVNFGCRLNIAEGEAVRIAAGDAGARDTIIFNSCAVTDEAVRQVRQAVRRARRERPEAAIVVTGCAAELEPARFSAMGARVVANDAKRLAESYRRIDGQTDPPASSTQTGLFHNYAPSLSGADHARAFLGVQTGCSHSCTFCATVMARGAARSATVASVVEAARTAIARGQRELILTGVDLASYGDDNGTTLADLVEALLSKSGLERLRLSSLDPDRIDDALFGLLTQEARVMPHIHLSLQAGDDMILKRMKRRHSRADAVKLVERLKAARADIAIGADLIAGFPTEDDAMFANTMALLDDCDIIFGHIFPYSPREGTAAARMPGQDRGVARARAAQLRATNAKRRHAWLDTLVGSEQAMLVERDGVNGHAENFAAMRLCDPSTPGAVIAVRVLGRDADQLMVQEMTA